MLAASSKVDGPAKASVIATPALSKAVADLQIMSSRDQAKATRLATSIDATRLAQRLGGLPDGEVSRHCSIEAPQPWS